MTCSFSRKKAYNINNQFIGLNFVSITKDRNIVHMTHKDSIDIVIGCVNGMAYGGIESRNDNNNKIFIEDL
jgi:hypothetical protein